ncbi:MAG: hypothetical protein S4CHLAM102_02750 [Chlamydiia bacterium]|nr:hypothetical protein [Chlamydiia bacterium]
MTQPVRFDGFNIQVNIQGTQSCMAPINFLGYLPGPSVIIGMMRTTLACCAICINPDWAAINMVRGIFEMSCVGFIFMFYDLGCWQIDVHHP